MTEDHLQQISLTPTAGRQTPRRDFGDVLGQVVAGAASLGADLLAPAASGNLLLSAAVSGVRSLAQGALAQASGSVRVAPGAAAGDFDPMSAVNANRQLMLEGAQINDAYLRLQREMQRESQQFNAVSNVMKVRHDSAKAAINNIR